MAKKVNVPTINDETLDFDILFEIWEKTNNCDDNISFDFTNCSFLRQNAVAFLGGLSRLLESQDRKFKFKWETLSNRVLTNLQQNGFFSTFSGGAGPWKGNSIPYREDFDEDHNSFLEYLKDDWLGRGWVDIESDLSDAIAGKVVEIYLNAHEHSKSKIGIMTCGQYFPWLNLLKLTLLDFGVGIPQNVRNYLGNQELKASKTLRWAFQRGASTTNIHGRGLGLDLLKDFIQANAGRLEIYSHEGYVLIDKNGETFKNRTSFFEGTIVNITIQCDKSYYV